MTSRVKGKCYDYHFPIKLSSFSHIYMLCEVDKFHFHRLYWLEITVLKSAFTNGTDIKSHIITSGATELFVYKVLYYFIYIFESIINHYQQNLILYASFLNLSEI